MGVMTSAPLTPVKNLRNREPYFLLYDHNEKGCATLRRTPLSKASKSFSKSNEPFSSVVLYEARFEARSSLDQFFLQFSRALGLLNNHDNDMLRVQTPRRLVRIHLVFPWLGASPVEQY